MNGDLLLRLLLFLTLSFPLIFLLCPCMCVTIGKFLANGLGVDPVQFGEDFKLIPELLARDLPEGPEPLVPEAEREPEPDQMGLFG